MFQLNTTADDLLVISSASFWSIWILLIGFHLCAVAGFAVPLEPLAEASGETLFCDFVFVDEFRPESQGTTVATRAAIGTDADTRREYDKMLRDSLFCALLVS